MSEELTMARTEGAPHDLSARAHARQHTVVKDTATYAIRFDACQSGAEAPAIVKRNGATEMIVLDRAAAIRHIVKDLANELGLTVRVVDVY